MRNTRIYWLHTLSPTHTGIGRGVGYIDLPIDRDCVTGWPVIRGSAFKGVWADRHGATERARSEDKFLRAAFGITGQDDNSSRAGALIPTDATLVCLPVRSFRGTFAWATSRLCLQLLRRTFTLAGMDPDGLPEIPTGNEEGALHGDEVGTIVQNDKIYLEDLDFSTSFCGVTKAWATKIAQWVFYDDPQWQEAFRRRFVVLPNLAFDFLCETGTEVHTRVKIDDTTGTVDGKALWTEESLPAETILAGVIQCDRVFGAEGATGEINPDALIEKFAFESLTLQIGGKASVGRGRVRCVFTTPGAEV